MTKAFVIENVCLSWAIELFNLVGIEGNVIRDLLKCYIDFNNLTILRLHLPLHDMIWHRASHSQALGILHASCSEAAAHGHDTGLAS